MAEKNKLSDEVNTRVSRFLEHHYGKPITSVEQVDDGFKVAFNDGTGQVDTYATDDVDAFVKNIPDTY